MITRIQTYTFLLASLIVLFLTGGISPAVRAEIACSADMVRNTVTGACAPINDARNVILRQPTAVPNIRDLRLNALSRTPAPSAAPVAPSVPPPGGLGAGTIYKRGALRATRQGSLHTDMFIHPYGYEPSTLGMEWLFTTATNRVEMGVEVVGIYHQADPTGALGVFDWSCSSAYPCDYGIDQPSWMWVSDFVNFSCNTGDVVDDGGHLQKVIRYVNKSVKLDNRNPALWRNSVYLWNFCRAAWDMVYEHTYRANQDDCSATGACAWWGPILETFRNESEPVPEIKELGFQNTALFHDGKWSTLTTAETSFVSPSRPWQLLHVGANRSYGIGNRYTPAPLVNNSVSFVADPSTIRYEPGSPSCPSEFQGKLEFMAQLTNESSRNLNGLIIELRRMASGNLALVDGKLGGAREWFAVPQNGRYADARLSPGEMTRFPFAVCMRDDKPLSLDINVRRIGKQRVLH